MAEAWAAPGGLDATPIGLCVASCGTGRCRLPPGGRAWRGGPVSHAIPGRGRRGTGLRSLRRPRHRRHSSSGPGCGASGQAAAKAARGAEVLPGPGGRPVRAKTPLRPSGRSRNAGPAPAECGKCGDAERSGQPAAAQGTGPPWWPPAGRGHPEDQVLVLYRRNHVALVSHVSSAGGYYFCSPNGCGDAITPTGDFTTLSFMPGWVTAPLGQLYNPVFFIGTIFAIHGDTHVPLRPASPWLRAYPARRGRVLPHAGADPRHAGVHPPLTSRRDP